MRSLLQIMAESALRQASDIFITVGVPPVLKIEGQLQRLPGEPLKPEETAYMAAELSVKRDELGRDGGPGERDFSVSLPDVGRFRANVFLQRGSVAISIRRIYSSLPSPESLRIPLAVQELADRTKGLVLVTGPAGSGKTTTLATLIDRINHRRECHVLTLEDPIEYLHRHGRSIINQREIGGDTRSYAEGLRSALRESPDVILIGEMRDLETIAIALTAAETGHLVLSTLHTVGTAMSIDRIVDVFPPNQQQQVRIQLSTVLQAVVSQQLLPSVDATRIAAFEVMLVNPAVRNMIRESKTPQIDSVLQMNAASGMRTMDMSLAELVNEGRVLLEDARPFSINQDTFLRMVRPEKRTNPDDGSAKPRSKHPGG
jgi:twitching motility protein PilT